MADRAWNVGFLVVDGVFNTELTAPFDIFHHTRFRNLGHGGLVPFVVSPDGAPVRTFEGLTVHADHSFSDHPPIDVLVVPSAEHSMDTDLADTQMIDWVRRGRSTWVWPG